MKRQQIQGEWARWLALQSPADLRVLARGWKLSPNLSAEELATATLDPSVVQTQWERLSEGEQAALRGILTAGGTLPVAIMEREHGRVRDIANFPNARGYLEALTTPPSPAERLYLLGLIIRHHDERGQIYKVPRELAALLPSVPPPDRHLHLALQPPPSEIDAGNAGLIEQMIELLLTLTDHDPLQTLDDGSLNKKSMQRVAAQMEPLPNLRGVRREFDWPWLAFVRTTLVSAGLLRRTTDGHVHVTAAGEEWLRSTPTERSRVLLEGWIASPIDELTLLAGLRWRSTPFGLKLPATRRTLLSLLATLPPDGWVALPDLVEAVHAVDPYFLRRDGRYDTWLLYDSAGQLLAGETHWSAVEGLLIEYVVYILHWLALADVGVVAGTQTRLLRLTPLGLHLLAAAPPPPPTATEPLIVQSTFEVLCPPGAAPHARFQLARIAERVSTGDVAIYKLTRKSLLHAADRGITGEQALAFLRDASATALPPIIEYSLREWSSQAGQVTLESAALLAADPVLLAEIRRSKAVKLPVAEELRPDLWRIPEGDAAGVAERLKAAGFGVTADVTHGTTPLSEHDLKALVSAAYAYAAVCDAWGLPCEVSAAMMIRLRKLVPSRHADAAYWAGEELRKRIAGIEDA